MNTGSVFYIGKTHKICQDYGLAVTSKSPYIIVSDGCSNSPQTDFGSRILSHVCSDMLSSNQEFNMDELMMEAEEIRRLLKLHPNSLDATLLYAKIIDNKYTISMFGDGTAVKVKKDGKVEIINIEYLSGAPFYYSYHLNEFRKNNYLKEFNLDKKITKLLLSSDYTLLDKDIAYSSNQDYFLECGDACDYNMITLLSDGISSFLKVVSTNTSKTQESLSLEGVLSTLLDFKNFHSDFVERRFNKFRKECESNGWFHGDDLTLSVIYLGDL